LYKTGFPRSLPISVQYIINSYLCFFIGIYYIIIMRMCVRSMYLRSAGALNTCIVTPKMKSRNSVRFIWNFKKGYMKCRTEDSPFGRTLSFFFIYGLGNQDKCLEQWRPTFSLRWATSIKYYIRGHLGITNIIQTKIR